MRIVANVEEKTKRVVFEPGNCTRYHLLVTYIKDQVFLVIDVNYNKVIHFSTVTESEGHIQFRLEEEGYDVGDAKPMAEMLANTFREFA